MPVRATVSLVWIVLLLRFPPIHYTNKLKMLYGKYKVPIEHCATLHLSLKWHSA